MRSPRRPLPTPSQETQPYWEAAKRHRLLIQRCNACGRHQFYPRLLCRHCGSVDVRWVSASGRGHVYSFTVNYRAASPAFEPLVPYIVALIDLEEGARLMSNLVECAPEDVQIGMKVEAIFVEMGEGALLPQFRPRSG